MKSKILIIQASDVNTKEEDKTKNVLKLKI